MRVICGKRKDFVNRGEKECVLRLAPPELLVSSDRLLSRLVRRRAVGEGGG